MGKTGAYSRNWKLDDNVHRGRAFESEHTAVGAGVLAAFALPVDARVRVENTATGVYYIIVHTPGFHANITKRNLRSMD